MSNSFDQDQARHYVWPGLGPNCLNICQQTTKVDTSRPVAGIELNTKQSNQNKSSPEGRQKLNPILFASLVMSQFSFIMATYLHNHNKVLCKVVARYIKLIFYP